MATLSDEITVYFAFGSNLSLSQMRQRCPTSKYLGIARLDNYVWIIKARGYANIVEQHESQEHPASATEDVVWGLVFSLQTEDEENLDMNEGVPYAYAKEYPEISFWATPKAVNDRPEARNMLVYIDRQRTDGDFEPKEEYIVRMNNGIKDALAMGVPEDYVANTLRRWIPEQSPEEAKQLAMKQALRFEEEK